MPTGFAVDFMVITCPHLLYDLIVFFYFEGPYACNDKLRKECTLKTHLSWQITGLIIVHTKNMNIHFSSVSFDWLLYITE